MTRFQLKAILLSFLVAGCHSAKKVEAPRLQLKEAVESRYRSDKNRQRDVYRHPLETLEFFGLEPAMTVVEITPGGGWYTEILAPLSRGRRPVCCGYFS